MEEKLVGRGPAAGVLHHKYVGLGTLIKNMNNKICNQLVKVPTANMVARMVYLNLGKNYISNNLNQIGKCCIC